MDIFNRKKVKNLESRIAELEDQLMNAYAFRSTVYVSKGDVMPLVVAVHMSDQDMEIPTEIIKRRICNELARKMVDDEMVQYKVTDDPKTMSHILHARIDVVNRG